MPNKTIYIRNEDLELFDEAQNVGGESVSKVIIEALKQYVDTERQRRAKREEQHTMATLIDGLVHRAVHARASDIHIQPTRDGNQVRFRIDGLLREIEAIPAEHYHALIDQLEAEAAANARSSAPGAGILSRNIDGQHVDMRISVVHSILGPSLTARLLLPDAALPGLDRLEPNGENAPALAALVDKTHGLVAVTGPTGAGKTTTIYSMLRAIDRTRCKVMTVEDPVESIIDGCVQIPIDRTEGTSFAPALARVMLGDIDVLYVAELRDAATVEWVLKAALTGHLVFVSLHALDTVRALRRLVDATEESPFMVRDALAGVVAQRLVRRLCEACKAPEKQQDPRLEQWGLPTETRFCRPVGCPVCHQTGYRGRLPLFEVHQPGDQLTAALLAGAEGAELQRAATAEGMRTLLADGIAKAASGQTTLSEVMRVAG